MEKFFGRVNHNVLMARVNRKVKYERILALIYPFFRGEVVSPGTEGTPQGGPLSPLLSILLLDDLDKELEQGAMRSAGAPTTAKWRGEGGTYENHRNKELLSPSHL
jgi:RNA-directed DNA polymerase